MSGITMPGKEDGRKRMRELMTAISVLTKQARKLRESGDFEGAYDRLDAIEDAEREFSEILSELERSA
jgi:hypothetical protein